MRKRILALALIVVLAFGLAACGGQSSANNNAATETAATTAETAKRVEKLVSSPSLGIAYHKYWGAQNGAKKVMSKSGKSYRYVLNNGKTLNFDRIRTPKV